MKYLLTPLLALGLAVAHAAELHVVEQDYPAARALAAAEGKLVFVDFYTTWCGPCKQLDRLVFRRDSARRLLAGDVVLLRYDAERDTAHHLAKKYHIASYPTGLLLTPEGRVVGQQYGFRGEGAAALTQGVLDSVAEGRRRAAAGQHVLGYAPEIDPATYPEFYVAYVERTDTDLVVRRAHPDTGLRLRLGSKRPTVVDTRPAG